MAGHAIRRWRALTAGILIATAALSPALAARRVVSTNLCTDEYVFRLVPRAQIAALSYLATETRPTVSTIAAAAKGIRTIRPGVETVLALRPDLVVLQAGTDPRLRDALRRAHIPVLDLPWANSLADIRAITRKMGAGLGAPGKADALLADMEARLAATRRQAPHPAVTVLFYQPNGYVATSAAVDEILAAAGGRDIAADLHPGPTGSVPVETLLAGAPQLILRIDAGAAGAALAARPLHHPALAALKGRSVIGDLSAKPFLCPGPWSAEAATTLVGLTRKAARHTGALAPPRPRH